MEVVVVVVVVVVLHSPNTNKYIADTCKINNSIKHIWQVAREALVLSKLLELFFTETGEYGNKKNPFLHCVESPLLVTRWNKARADGRRGVLNERRSRS